MMVALGGLNLVNLTSPGRDFSVGDAFRLTVTGEPNREVRVEDVHDGTPGSMVFGQTDNSGVLVIENLMKTEHEGSWRQDWFVGDSLAGSLNFEVHSAGWLPTTTAPQITNGPISVPSAVATPSPGVVDNLMGASVLGVPLWILAAGAGGLLLLKGK